MKKLNLLILCALSLSIVCQAANNGGGEYTLAYKLKKGEVYKQSLETEITMSMAVMGQDIDVLMNTNVTIALKVIDVKDGISDLQLTYERMKISSGMSSFILSFDTENLETDGQFAEIGKMLKSMMGIPIDVQMDKQGKILAVQGFDRILAKIEETVAKSDNAVSKKIIAEQVKSQFSEEAVKSMSEQFQINYPNHSLKIGDSWDTEITKSVNGMTMSGNLKYTLKAVEGNIATLEGSGILEMPEQTVQSEQGEAKVSVKGDFTTTTKVSLATGMPVSGDENMILEIKTAANGVEIPMKTTIKITLKTE